jgi:hypothetical protein
VGAALLVALTLPGLVLLLVAVATVEQVAARLGRAPRRGAASAAGLDVFSAALAPGRAVDLEQRRVRELTRDEAGDGAPPHGRIDLDGGVAWLRRPPGDGSRTGGAGRSAAGRPPGAPGRG